MDDKKKFPGFMGDAAQQLSKKTGDNLYGKKPQKPIDEETSSKNNVPKSTAKSEEPVPQKASKQKNEEPVPQKAPKAKRGTGSSKSQGEAQLTYLPANKFSPWKYANRPDSEFGDMYELTASIKANGQEVPALARPIGGGKYELIYGRRRWTACGDLGIDLFCMIREMDDQEAFVAQALENEDRKDLSSYARALDYKNALDQGIFKSQAALAASLGMDRTSISSILQFTKLPPDLVSEIGDMTNVGIKTAKAINRLLDEKPERLSDLISVADKIGSGSFAESAIRKIGFDIDDKKGSSGKVTTKKYRCKAGNVFSVKTSEKGELIITILEDGKKVMDGDNTIQEILGIFEARADLISK